MNAKDRRKKILQMLSASGTPVSASVLASEFNVSRQVIVGDVSILRASGIRIDATPRGYILEDGNKEDFPFIGTIVCRHDQLQAEAELNTIVDYGGTCIDVAIEHSIFGELIGPLNISTRYDVKLYMEKQKSADKPLSFLSDGYHIHHIGCKDREIFDMIAKELRDLGILIDES